MINWILRQFDDQACDINMATIKSVFHHEYDIITSLRFQTLIGQRILIQSELDELKLLISICDTNVINKIIFMHNFYNTRVYFGIPRNVDVINILFDYNIAISFLGIESYNFLRRKSKTRQCIYQCFDHYTENIFKHKSYNPATKTDEPIYYSIIRNFVMLTHPIAKKAAREGRRRILIKHTINNIKNELRDVVE